MSDDPANSVNALKEASWSSRKRRWSAEALHLQQRFVRIFFVAETTALPLVVVDVL